jgi:hypothetical protein
MLPLPLLLVLLTALTLSPSPVNFPRYPALDLVLLFVTNTNRLPCTNNQQHTRAFMTSNDQGRIVPMYMLH